MNNQIDERIKIAKSFKSIYNWKGKTPEKREKTLKMVAFSDYGIVTFLLFVCILASAMTIFQTQSISSNWEKSGLLVLLTMSFSLRSPFSFIELILNNHIKKIENVRYQFDNELNNELDNIITKLNRRKKYIYLIGLPAILIFIPAMLQVFNANPYWDKFPPFVLTVSLYILVRIHYDIMKLKRNLKRVESIN